MLVREIEINGFATIDPYLDSDSIELLIQDIATFNITPGRAGISHVQPPRAILEQMLTVRIHLDRTDESNGALKVIPGSHRQGKLSNLEIDGSKYLQVFLAIARLGEYS